MHGGNRRLTAMTVVWRAPVPGDRYAGVRLGVIDRTRTRNLTANSRLFDQSLRWRAGRASQGKATPKPECRLVKAPAKAGAWQRFFGQKCAFAAATAKPPGSRVSCPGPAVWCRQTRRNARLHCRVLRSFRWNAKVPNAPAPLL